MITAAPLVPSMPPSLAGHTRSAATAWGHGLLVLIVLVWGAGLFVGFEPALAMMTIASFAAVVIGLARPVLGLFGVGMLSTLDAASRVFLLEGGLWRWNTINYWLLLVMLLTLPYLLRLKDAQSRILQALLLLLVLELLISANRRLGAQHILGLAVVFGLLVYFTRAGRDKHVWYWLGVVNGTLAAATGLVFYLQFDRLPYINPNAWAYVPLTGVFAICLGLLAGRLGRRRQTTLILLAMVNVAWVLLSGSRGTLLSAVTALAIVASAIRPLRRGPPLLVVGLLLAIVIGAQFAELETLGLRRLGALFDPDRSLISRTSGRSDLMIAGWHLFLRHPLGVGTGGFPDAWAALGDLEGRLSLRQVGEERQAHSAWVQTLAENGLPGIVLLAAYVASFAIVGWRRSKCAPNLRRLGLLTTAVLSVAFVSTSFQGKGLWLLAAGATTLFRRAAAAQPEHSGRVRGYRR